MPPLTRQGTLDSLELRAARSPKPAPPPCARAGESRAGLSWQRLLLVLLLAASPLAAQTEPRPAAPNERRAVIIDTDPGTDDAMAILLALSSPELDVRAFTVVPGNVTADQALDNALRLVSLAGRCDVPVAGGARRPLAQKLITAEFVHGENGLAGIELPAPGCAADARFAPDLIIDLVHAMPGEITLVPVGPLTNIALALLKDPTIVPLVKEVVIMGGSITEGNVTAVAEANIFNDPEAAELVFQAGWKVTMVGLDVTHKTNFGRQHLERLARTHGTLNDFATEVMAFLVELAADFGADGTPMHDPLAVGVVLDPSFVRTRHMRIDVETRGEHTRGATVGNRHNAVERNEPEGDRLKMTGIDRVEPNAHVAVEVDAERFLALFIERLRNR
ncbi:MAG: nucleoside hydrolase [Acidobacteriota bacterium]|nr:nucleoside hydrolase [Acidobacteriota bacterium]MDH3522809.1 nucleoside hydrolase [Acidobacteriota bacterium]